MSDSPSTRNQCCLEQSISNINGTSRIKAINTRHRHWELASYSNMSKIKRNAIVLLVNKADIIASNTFFHEQIGEYAGILKKRLKSVSNELTFKKPSQNTKSHHQEHFPLCFQILVNFNVVTENRHFRKRFHWIKLGTDLERLISFNCLSAALIRCTLIIKLVNMV